MIQWMIDWYPWGVFSSQESNPRNNTEPHKHVTYILLYYAVKHSFLWRNLYNSTLKALLPIKINLLVALSQKNVPNPTNKLILIDSSAF